jgi:hypothetical protein
LKVLYLAVPNLDEFRSPSVGTRSSGWKIALQAFTIYFEGRTPRHDRHDHLPRPSDAPVKHRGYVFGLVEEVVVERLARVEDSEADDKSVLAVEHRGGCDAGGRPAPPLSPRRLGDKGGRRQS